MSVRTSFGFSRWQWFVAGIECRVRRLIWKGGKK